MSRNRAIETRANEMRDDYDMYYCNRFDVPLEVYEPEKFNYHWPRYSVKGEPDSRVEKLLRQGWELVPRLKESPLDTDPLMRDPNTKKFYIVEGNILMRLEKEIYKKREAYKYKQNEDKLREVKIATNDASSFIRPSNLMGF